MNDVKDLVKEFSHKNRKLVHSSDGKIVVDFSPLDGKAHFPDIRVLRFQHFFKNYFGKVLDNSMSIEEAITSACNDGHISQDWINKHLKSPRYKKWIADRVDELAAAEGVTPAYIVKKHKLNIEGELVLTASQQTSLAELGDRVWPKVQKIEHDVHENVSYSMDDLMKARKEVEELETQIKNTKPAA